MKKRKSSRHTPTGAGDPGLPPPPEAALPEGPTGRSIVVLRPGAQKALAKALSATAGLKVASSADFEDAAVNDANIGGADALLLEHLDVAVVKGDSDQIRLLEMAVADESNPVLSVEPEMFVIPFYEDSDQEGNGDSGQSLLTSAGREYFRGFGDAIQLLGSRLMGKAASEAGLEVEVAASFADTSLHTWGLQATRVGTSRCTGRGIRVAVLDTGFDLKHPDFAGRSVISASFVPGQTAQDGHSHGTHCIGTACGPKIPAGNVRRYGVAHEATILVGKVLSNQGSGMQGWILAGINWAIQNKAVVISMSLGSRVQLGGTFSPAYEQAALAALNNNCLIVAAAGNDGQSPIFYPVGSPANCPSVVAVAAVDSNLQRAAFSCIGVNPNGGEVNIAAPGVNVFSSVPMPARYGYKSGTSMAAPHVAGIAALWAQWSGLRGKALWTKLTSTIKNINQPVQHVGSGLVQASRCGISLPPFPRPIPIPYPGPIPIPGPIPPFPIPQPGPFPPGPIPPGPKE